MSTRETMEVTDRNMSTNSGKYVKAYEQKSIKDSKEEP